MLLETERLIITELTMDMAAVISENSLDEDNQRFVPDEVFETEEDAAEVIEYLIEQYGDTEGPLLYAIITKDGEDNIGYVQMVPLSEGEWEVGYHIAKPYTGRGYASEAVAAFVPLMAEEIGITEVVGICLLENAASIKVMENCGFEIEFEGMDEYQGEPAEIHVGIWRA